MENKNPIVTFELESGKVIKAELYPEVAPNTVKNFISLVNKEFYNGLIFHRVIKVDEVANMPTDYMDRPFEDVVMKNVTVDTFGVEYGEPEKC